MFWTRIGTPTGDHESGTLEEIQEHIDAGKPAMICFSDQPVQMGSVEPEQYNKLMEFKKECYGKGLVSGYDTLEVFKTILSDALIRRVNNKEPFVGFGNSENETGIRFDNDSTVVIENSISALSNDAKELLLEASNDPDGDIMNLSYIGGATIQTNGRNFLTDNTAREKARWEAALTQLLEKSLVENVSYKGEIYRVTHSGYQIADQLKKA